MIKQGQKLFQLLEEKDIKGAKNTSQASGGGFSA